MPICLSQSRPRPSIRLPFFADTQEFWTLRRMQRFCALLALWIWSAASAGTVSSYTGRVIGVHDGDTLTLLTADKQQIKVRLADIDAPELGQAFGQASKKALSALCFDKQAVIQQRTIDKYGRIVGVVTCAGTDVASVLIQEGMAWVYRDYLMRPSLIELETYAKASRLGLWVEASVPPWVFRRQHPSPLESDPVPAIARSTTENQKPASSSLGQPIATSTDTASGAPLNLNGIFDEYTSEGQATAGRESSAPGSTGCASGSGRICTGPKGGRYVVSPNGSKEYVKKK